MPLILLIRHAENPYLKQGRLAGRLPGVHLNDAGRTQAQTLAETLTGTPIKAIYSSPMERALETALPIAQVLGLAIIPTQGLIEVNCGDWAGKTVKSLRRLRLWKTVQNTPSQFQFPGGETFVEAQNRIYTEIETLAKQHDPKDLIVCFSHSDPIKLFVARCLGMPLDNFQRLSVSPASITAVFFGEQGGNLLTMNYAGSSEHRFPFSQPKG